MLTAQERTALACLMILIHGLVETLTVSCRAYGAYEKATESTRPIFEPARKRSSPSTRVAIYRRVEFFVKPKRSALNLGVADFDSMLRNVKV